MLTLGRVLLGVGLGSVLLAGLKAFALWWPAHRYATVSGLYFAVGSLGALLAASPLAWANATIGWRASFVAAAVVVGLVAVVLALRTPSTPTRRDPSTAAGAEPRRARCGRRDRDPDAPRFRLHGPGRGVPDALGRPLPVRRVRTDAATTGRLLLVLSLGITVGYAASGALADRFGLYRVTVIAALAFVADAGGAGRDRPAASAARAGGRRVRRVRRHRRPLRLGARQRPRALLGAARSGRGTGAINAASIGGVFVLQWGMGVVVESLGGADGYRVALVATAALTLVALAVHAAARRRLGRAR